MAVNKRNKTNLNCVTVYPQCIEWNLAPIPCLGINTGDTLDEITFAIVRKICEIAGDDLSTIDVQCLVDKLDAVEPLNKTLHSYLQLIIDNECKLSDLITAINNRIDGIANPTLILDLKCLATIDSFGNQLPYNEQSVLQALISQACLIRNQITGLTGAIANANIRIDNLPPAYVEPKLTSCLYTSQPTSVALSLLASDYCTYKTLLGTVANIQTAVGRQCSGLNTKFAADPKFIQSPTSQAHSLNNLWIAFCDQSARLAALEACACKVTCKDVLVGFAATFNDDKTVSLKFTGGAGTFIPVGYADCGSSVTIKNDAGVTTNPISIVIAQEGETIDIDISMFEGGEYLTFSVNAAICGNGINCNKCVSRVIRNTSGCCLITNSGTTPLTLTYKTCGITVPTVGA